MLALWRETRHPDVARVLIEGRSRRSADRLPAGRRQADHQAWFVREQARRPEDLGGLLDAVWGAGLPNGARPSVRQALARLNQLVAWEPDPRLGEAMLALTKEAPYASHPWSHPWWQRVRHVMEANLPHDFDFAEHAAAIIISLVGRVTARHLRLANWIGTFRSHAPPPVVLTPHQQSQLERWQKAMGQRPLPALRPSTETVLLAAIEAAPWEDERRRVYLDWLKVHRPTDPRTTFLSEQIENHDRAVLNDDRTRVLVRRRRPQASSSLQASFATWFGAHFMTMASVRFRLGFPFTATLARHLHQLPNACGEPGLRTLEALVVRRDLVPSRKRLVTFLEDPGLRHLRYLEGVTDADLKKLRTPACALRHLALHGEPTPQAHFAPSLKRWPALEGLRYFDRWSASDGPVGPGALRARLGDDDALLRQYAGCLDEVSLHLDLPLPAPGFELPAVATLVLPEHHAAWTAWVEDRPRIQRLVVGPSRRTTDRVVFERGPDGRFQYAEVTGYWSGPLQAATDALKRVVYHPTVERPGLDKFADWCADKEIEGTVV
ncbi:MAG: hypothetical protein AAGA48_08695 [Myxococcota bacterium]